MNVKLVHEFRFEAAHRLPKVPAGNQATLTATYLGSDLVQQASVRTTVRFR